MLSRNWLNWCINFNFNSILTGIGWFLILFFQDKEVTMPRNDVRTIIFYFNSFSSFSVATNLEGAPHAGIWGQPRVNVLELNLALSKGKHGDSRPTSGNP